MATWEELRRELTKDAAEMDLLHFARRLPVPHELLQRAIPSMWQPVVFPMSYELACKQIFDQAIRQVICTDSDALSYLRSLGQTKNLGKTRALVFLLALIAGRS